MKRKIDKMTLDQLHVLARTLPIESDLTIPEEYRPACAADALQWIDDRLRRELVDSKHGVHHKGYAAALRALKPGESFTYPSAVCTSNICNTLRRLTDNETMAFSRKGRTVTRLS
jgi:hypothetical protein